MTGKKALIDSQSEATIKDTLRVLRSMSNEELAAKIKISRKKDNRFSYSDKTLKNKTYALRRLLRLDDSDISKIVSAKTDSELDASGIPEARYFAYALRAIGIGRPLLKARKRAVTDAATHAMSIDRISSAVTEFGPITLEGLADRTGYTYLQVRKGLGKMRGMGGVSQFSLRIGGSSPMFGAAELFPTLNTNLTYVMDDADPASLGRLELLLAGNCATDLSIGMKSALGRLLNELKTVIPGAAYAIDRARDRIFKRDTAVETGIAQMDWKGKD